MNALVVRLVALALLVTAVVAGGMSIRKAYSERTLFKQQLAAEKARTEDYQQRVLEANRLAEKRAVAAERIRTVTKETIREVRVRVPADACPLPSGFRVLHDAAAQGEPASAPGGPDAAPVPAQDAAETVVENYGVYHDTADRLRKLQEWVRSNLK